MSATPDVTAIAFVRCPKPLRDLPAFLMWRYEPSEVPGGKPKKVPYYTNGGRRRGQQGTPEDRAHLTTFAAAKSAAARRGMDGVGMALLADWGITALDFDACVVDGEVVGDVADAIMGTYAELSPSGTGVRAIVSGQLGNLKSHATDGRWGMETFSSAGFVTLTGNMLPWVEMLGLEDTVGPINEALMRLHQQRFGERGGAGGAEGGDPLMDYEPVVGVSLDEMRRVLGADSGTLPYEASGGPSWLSVGMAIHHETGGSDEGWALWDAWSRGSAKYGGERYGRVRWDSFGRRKGRAVTWRSVIKWARDGLLGDGFEDLTADAGDGVEAAEVGAAVEVEKVHKFRPHAVGAFLRRPPTRWIIKDVLPAAPLTITYGASGAGKSFIVLDMAICVARGVEWRGKRVRQGRVVYICAEGAGGFGMRLRAYAQHWGVDLDELGIGVIDAVPDFMARDQVVELAKQIKAWGGADLVIVDTFARVTAGANENAGEDMSLALKHCDGLSRALGRASVLLVHHSGKDAARGARGWSGLKAAADAELEVTRAPGSNVRSLVLGKQKDASDIGAFPFQLEVVPVGVDEHGDPVTSCVAVEVATNAPTAVPTGPTKKLGDVEREMLEVLEEMLATSPEGVEIEDVIGAVRDRRTEPDGSKPRKTNLRRSLLGLVADPGSGLVVDDERVTKL